MPPIAQLLLELIPGVVTEIQNRAAAANQPVPTAQEILDTLESTFNDEISKDEMLKAVLSASS